MKLRGDWGASIHPFTYRTENELRERFYSGQYVYLTVPDGCLSSIWKLFVKPESIILPYGYCDDIKNDQNMSNDTLLQVSNGCMYACELAANLVIPNLDEYCNI